MNKRSNKKYIVFPIIMIIVALMISMNSYCYRGFEMSNIEVIKIMDITGYTLIFLISFLIINILVLIFCLYKGKQASTGGYDYKFNKVFALMFFILAIVPIITFINIRNQEEKQAEQLNQEIEEVVGSLDFKDKKVKSKLKQIIEKQELLEEDKFYKRKTEIYNEMKKIESKFERYISLYYYRFENNFAIMSNERERYYAIFSVFSLFDAICGAFYFISIKDGLIANKTEILE